MSDRTVQTEVPQSFRDAIKDAPKAHRFNDRLFCSNCGADAIGLQGRGKDAMVCRG